ncbi:hypothetical protein FACS1894184_15990 [Clostridia bacterium]|nr:hypothetical protein FACS1894184_15990 [Clostridia bacterium]
MKIDIIMIKQYLKKNRNLENISRTIMMPWFIYTKAKFDINLALRYIGINKNNYSKIATLKDKHKEERCFIVATGPSLTVNDLNRLKNDITISVNSIVDAFAESDWRPTYYGICDEKVVKKLRTKLDTDLFELAFIGSNIKHMFENKTNIVPFPLDLMWHRMINAKPHTKFSTDCSVVVYDGYSIVYNMLQIAVYMGFKDIYLLGTDCDYSMNTKHFNAFDVEDKKQYSYGDLMIYAYHEAYEFCRNHNVNIYNTTRGGKLEVFPRVNYESLFTEKEGTVDA